MDNNLGNIIKDIRTKKKMSQRYLADRAGISYSYLCNVENGKHKPSYEVLFKLSKVLDVTISAFESNDSDNNYLIKELIKSHAQELVDITSTVIDHVNNSYVLDKYDLSTLDGDAVRDIHGLIVDVVKNRLNKYCKKIGE
ncbi:helix-turn-helix domain-containing protein [Terrisporobacter mayombei]|uniref:HTH cro/C1-type domain-containing protein n=1 Tax=Terrisporobacter mayombei TaxID=1541 RepID=A0ABY9Q6M7_9FIRM|nr:helix-turn-helix transcriptional regulator [Terrisporobacter mayombei]MCC3870395.1 helix-turn-helix domain-containing protein [Terrisporobacter mayombei]WMT83647.1 hypothetical protein TEMA_41680 [Terrisporobacter mayombei]